MRHGDLRCWRGSETPERVAEDVAEFVQDGVGLCVCAERGDVACRWPSSEELHVVAELDGARNLSARGGCSVGMHGGASCHRVLCGERNARIHCIEQSFHGDLQFPDTVVLPPAPPGEHSAQGELEGPTVCFGGSIDQPSTCRRLYRVHGAARMVYGRAVGCGIREGGSLACMGTNQHGQLAGRPDAGFHEVTEINLGGAIDVAIGEAHICALTDEGHAYCWGGASEGQMGAPPGRFERLDTVHIAPIVRVPGIDDAVQLHAGGNLSCVITARGAVQCWGGGEATPRTVFTAER
ncbi:MAG: hypothetical protein AAF938_02115 [Myxococcota bacterium]